MTRLLEQAVAEAAELPDDSQDALARWLLEELRTEKSWKSLLERSADELAAMADAALEEHHAGRTEALDVDSL